MSNLFSSLRASTSSLDAITKAVAITQNNVMNAGTAGYAKQRAVMEAQSFDPAGGMAGGVSMGPLQSSRDEYLERSVRLQNGKNSAAQADVQQLTKLEQVFQLTAHDSIPSTLNRFYSALSAWAVAPDDRGSKEDVFSSASELASSFRRTSQALTDLTQDNAVDLRGVVTQVNSLAQRIRSFNQSIRAGGVNDAGVDAGIHSTLDELSGLVNVEAVRQQDGTYTLLLAGEHPLVIGGEQYDLTISFDPPPSPPAVHPDAPPPATLKTATGHDVTGSIKNSKLSALIDFRRYTLAAVQGDSMQAGELNRLAKQISDRVNEAWPPPAAPFFVHGLSPIAVAHSLSVNPAIAPAMLSAVEPGPPEITNGKALQLSALAKPTKSGDMLDGVSFTEFFGRMATRVGSDLAEAKFTKTSQTQMAEQLRSMRDQVSGVSLDEEAVRLVEFQRAYQASARMVTALDEMLQIAVNLGRS